MKIGDLVKLKKPKLFQKTLASLTGVIVEYYPAVGAHRVKNNVCRVFWADTTPFVDKTWRLCSELEVVA